MVHSLTTTELDFTKFIEFHFYKTRNRHNFPLTFINKEYLNVDQAIRVYNVCELYRENHPVIFKILLKSYFEEAIFYSGEQILKGYTEKIICI